MADQEPTQEPEIVSSPNPQAKNSGHRARSSRGGYVAGIILITLGVIFLLQNFFNFEVFSKLWPLILVVIGVAAIANNRGR